MNSLIKTLAFCALLGASGGASAAPVLFPNGDFASAPTRGTWAEEFGGGTTTFSYPTTGGSGGSGGYGVMNNSGGWGIWVNSNNAPFTPAEMSSLGLTPGNGYTFFMDMKIETGAPNNILGRLKFEWAGVGGGTEEFVRTLIGDGTTWQRYTYNVIIPAGATGLKVVPVISDNARVGFDNIGFESVPYFVAPLPPPPPTDVVHENVFDVAGTNWGAPTGTPGPTASATFSNSEGNLPGSTILTVNKPAAGVADIFIDYTATGIDFGDGPVEISFDAKLLAPFPGTALHVRYNGNFVPAIQGNFNDSTYTTFTRTFDLGQGFSAATTLTLQFQFAMGGDPGAGGSIAIDNIRVKTNLPGSAPPTTASIETGKSVSWTPLVGNSYQPQEAVTNSLNDLDWTNVGDPISNPNVTSAFDNTPSPFYRVRETTPTVLDNQVFNPGFETDDDWFEVVAADGGTTEFAETFSGGFVPHGGSRMLVLQAKTGPVAPVGSAIAEVRSAQVPVTAGVTYNFSFYALNARKSDSTDAQYTFYYYNEFGVPIETPVINNFNVVGNTWTKVERSLTIPAEVGAVVIAFRLATGPIAALDWVSLIDDVSLDTGTVVTPSVTTTVASTAVDAAKVSWGTVTGRTYQAKSSLDLINWSNFGDLVEGDGSVYSVIDPIAPPSKFFRVLESTP